MPYNFKSDDSFLKKLAIGAAGTNCTIQKLSDMGFEPIELERGSTGFKIWKKIKIKRVRVPDIICLDTGLRIESRGKTKLEISMSHSLNDPKRSWNAGLRNDDYISILSFFQDETFPTQPTQVSPVHFIKVADLEEAVAKRTVIESKPKGFEEGSEVRLIWTCAIANEKSIVNSIDENKIVMHSIDNSKKQTIKLLRQNGKIKLIPQIATGQIVEKNQIVASIVPIHTSLFKDREVNEAYYIGKLSSFNLSERYAAAKALRFRGYEKAKDILISRMQDIEEDIYVQLEAAAALAAFNEPLGWDFLQNKLINSSISTPLETQLETIIVLSEIPDPKSELLLISVLKDSNREDELRSGAAWALGQFPSEASTNALVESFNLSPLDIKTEAARALLQIAEPNVSLLLDLLQSGNSNTRDGLAWVLAHVGNFSPSNITNPLDEDLQKWLSYIIGFGKDNFSQIDIDEISKTDPKVYFAASVLWQILDSWIYELKEF